MPSQPGVGDVHIDGLMTQISIAFTNEEYIAEQVFPIVMVDKQSDIIPQYPKAEFLRDVMQPWVPGTPGARSGYSVDTSLKYFCNGWKLGKLLPDDIVKNADLPFNMFKDAARWLEEQALLRWELEFASNFLGATGPGAAWTQKAAGTDFTAWDNYGGSDPINDLRVFADTSRTLTGKISNKAVMGKLTWDKLVDHPLIVDRLKYTSKESITKEMLAKLVGLETILIGSAINITSIEGETPDVVAEVFPKNVLLAAVPSSPGLLTPAAGYTFVWKPITGTPRFNRRLELPEIESTVLEVKSYFEIKQIDGDFGTLLTGVIA